MARLRCWAKRAGIALLTLVLVLAVASFAYDETTNGEMKPAAALYPGPFLRVNGTSVAFRRWGRAGSPIVLLGGFVEPSWVWRGVGAALGRSHRVFALDLPPFGYSERDGRYTLRDWIELVRGFDRTLGLGAPVVVGHSLGAAVAVGLALDHPREVRRIVLLDGDALSGGGPGWLAHLLVDPFFTSAYRLVTGSDWIFRRALHDALGPRHPAVDRAFLREWQQPFRVSGSEHAYRKLLSYGIQGFRLNDLRSVRSTPALVLWGADDDVDPVSAGRRSARALRARFVLLPRAGHLSMLADPGRLARAVGAFAR